MHRPSKADGLGMARMRVLGVNVDLLLDSIFLVVDNGTTDNLVRV